MRELINRNKFKIILATIAMLIPTLVGYFVFDRVLYLPIGLALLYIFVVLITFYSWRNKNQTDTAVNLLIYFFPALGLFVSFMHLLILEGGYSNPGLVFRVITAGTATLFIILANYMPKIKKNSTMGIRIPWTLASEYNWNKTHRFGSKLLMIQGFISLILSMFTLYSFPFFIITLLLIIIILCIYSYTLYKKEGEERLNPILKKTKVKLLITLLVVFIVTPIALLCGNINVKLYDDHLKASSFFFFTKEVNYSNIKEIGIIEENDEEREGLIRVGGIGNLRIAAGRFKNYVYDEHDRYTYQSCKLYIKIVEKDGSVLILNQKTDDDTKELYNNIQSKIGKN